MKCDCEETRCFKNQSGRCNIDFQECPERISEYSPPVCSAWDIVKLKDHTSLYRAYSLADGKFLFACIYADELRHSDNVQVEAVVPNAEDDRT